MPAFVILSGLRFIIGLPVAGAITAALFLLMSGVLKAEGELGEPREPIRPFTASIPDVVENTPPESKPIDEISSPPPPISTTSDYKGKEPNPLPSPPSPGPGTDGTGPITIPTALIPIIRIEPIYPDNCASRQITGSVVVEFEVSPEGSVQNPRIISSDNRCFNRSVLNAVRKWKYTPTGRTTRNVRTTLTFTL